MSGFSTLQNSRSSTNLETSGKVYRHPPRFMDSFSTPSTIDYIYYIFYTISTAMLVYKPHSHPFLNNPSNYRLYSYTPQLLSINSYPQLCQPKGHPKPICLTCCRPHLGCPTQLLSSGTVMIGTEALHGLCVQMYLVEMKKWRNGGVQRISRTFHGTNKGKIPGKNGGFSIKSSESTGKNDGI
jgi:hypothetical protein